MAVSPEGDEFEIVRVEKRTPSTTCEEIGAAGAHARFAQTQRF